jgi:hypothetical protein
VGEVAHGGEPVGWRKTADCDHHGKLGTELFETGNSASGVEADDEPARFTGSVRVLDDRIESDI